ncbi:MAG TPA: hypothetical protein VGS19_35545 [Streptosporangiaceae bacterium]|nr:hypothetical protein [Streptosporangiaceae bacterium]
MSAFFSELGKRVAEKWLALAVLPGLLFLSAVITALSLGHTHALDLAMLTSRAKAFAVQFNGLGPTMAVLLVAGAMLAATACGLAAQALATLIQHSWFSTWTWFAPLGDRLLAKRRGRWNDITDAIDDAVRAGDPKDRYTALAAARTRIAVSEPVLPSRIGDRLNAVDARVYAEYELDLVAAWPHLWLITPDTTRGELRTAAIRFSGTALQMSWGVLYTVLGLVWWPALFAGAVTLLTTWHRARDSAETYACLIEATVDLYGIELARSLGLAEEGGRFTADHGKAITNLVRKGR